MMLKQRFSSELNYKLDYFMKVDPELRGEIAAHALS